MGDSTTNQLINYDWETPGVVNLPHFSINTPPPKDMTGRKNLTEALTLLMNKPISKAEKYALQAIDSCNRIAGKAPQTFIALNYLPILEAICKNHAKGTWETTETGLFFTPDSD
jgi:hypothetical protein